MSFPSSAGPSAPAASPVPTDVPMAQGTGRSGGYRSPARQWFTRLLLEGDFVAAVASLRRTAAGQRLGFRVIDALGAQ